MKKLVVALMLCAMVVPAINAQDKDKKKKELHCAVMPQDKIDVKKSTKAKLFSDYKGNRYYFCCAGCKPAFDKDPEKYKDADHVPIPKKKG
ncbi:MAG: YHS domain-containing protein [Armatimonadota bacterium]